MSETPYLKLQLTPSSEWDTKKYGDFITELAGSDETSTLQKIDTAIKNVNDDLTSHEGDSISHITAEERELWNDRTPLVHASQHATGGSDPVTPAAIGAVAKSEKGVAGGIASLGSDGKVPSAQLPDLNYAPSTHASQHGASGSDPVTPAAIGAYPNGSKGAVNCNNLSDGAWTISASATNGPGAFACTLFHKDWNVDFASQIAFGADRNVYYRVKTSGSWLAWQEMYSTLRYPSPSKIGALPITGGTVTGHLSVKSFSLSDYSSAIEIGKNIDFHLNGSTNDFDARLAYDSGDLLFRLLGGDYKTILHTGNLSDNNISRMTLISYTGTGTSGESNKTTITCPAPPKMVIVFRKGTSLAPASKDTIGSEGDDCWGNGFMWTYGAYDVAIYEGAQARILEFTQSGNTLSWYANLASAQQNSSGDTYYALVWY